MNDGWIRCEKCGKKLLKRKENGIFSFRFGKRKRNSPAHDCVVEMEVFGSIKMKCMREDCQHENIFNFFPS